ncbi:DUF4192 family protein [Arcanobacterium ihumii]|uniref:DUF4192 family protein n=1 Tax=Arcanobacterium ihumii TaxID=2138162 RepID=UPI001356E332|nr:DUF4192 family protein [Arcanobacterium ihumii]
MLSNKRVGARGLGQALRGLDNIQVRDYVLIAAVTGRVDIALGTFDDVLNGACAQSLNVASVERAMCVLRACDNYLDVVSVPLHGVLAYLAWWSGDSGTAELETELALNADASYSLALLVRHALIVGLPSPVAGS